MRGRVRVVGIGPGAPAQRTYAAVEAIRDSDVVIGYRTYLSLIADLLDGKEVVPASMREEVWRASVALERALAGQRVALVSSGDPQVYGMAPLVLEMAARRGLDVEVEVVPGVTAALAAAARLGAPLGMDFAVISLSPLLVPREEILRRVEKAAEGDFVIAFYNPIDIPLLEEAMAVVARHRPPQTPVGVVNRAYREGERRAVADLAGWRSLLPLVDMGATLIVGNSSTFVHGGLMITPRGYGNKYRLA